MDLYGFLDTLGGAYSSTVKARSDTEIARINADSAARVADQASAAPAATLSAGLNLGGNTLLWIIGGALLVGGVILLVRR